MATPIPIDSFATFGELLKYLRRRARLSQRELSIAVGYSESQISRLEHNLSAPDPATLGALFVPALELENEPATAARLLELAAAVRAAPASEPVNDHGPASQPSNNLPLSLTSFVGREKEIAEVRRLLRLTRLLTLTGAGGSGKTRLALEVARAEVGNFPDGVWLIELAPLADPDLVPQTAAAVLGLREAAGRPSLTALMEYLQPRNTLLVLDNCEHVIQACARLAETLLRVSPNLRLLITSRETAGISGEMTFLVPTLSLPGPGAGTTPPATLAQSEAVRLFLDRAQTAWPGFQLTAGNAAAVAQVCQRLDGIPLALELAAARVKTMQMEEIAARLDNRFGLLTGGSRTALSRHQTLLASLEWSHALLSGPEQIVLRRLAVFAGGWTLAAAEAVCRGAGLESAAILDLLTQLINKSLVNVEQTLGQATRYQFLETIRQYAIDKLAEELPAARTNHLNYFLAFALTAQRAYYGEGQLAWMRRLDSERDNLWAALDWAEQSGQAQAGLQLGSALESYWYARGLWTEVRRRLEKLLARPEAAAPTPERALAMGVCGHFAVNLGDAETGLKRLGEAMALSRALGTAGRPALAWTMYWLGEALQKSDPTAGWQLLTESMTLAQSLDSTILIEIGLLAQGNIAAHQGNYSLAQGLYSAGRAHGLTSGNYWSQGAFAGALGWVSYMLGEYPSAAAFFQEGLSVLKEFGDVYSQAWYMEIAGCIAYLEGDYPGAWRWFEASLTLYRQIGRTEGVVWVLSDLAILAIGQNDVAEAGAWLREALTVLRAASRGTGGLARCLLGSAQLAPQTASAARLLAAAQAILGASGDVADPFFDSVGKRIETSARSALGEPAFAAAGELGRALTIPEALAEAHIVTAR